MSVRISVLVFSLILINTTFAQDVSNSTVLVPGSYTARTEADRWSETINVKDFGAVPNDQVADTTAINAAINFAISRLPATVFFPRGTYLFGQLTNLSYSGLSLRGAGSRETILKFVGSGPAIRVDAFSVGQQFIQRWNMEGLTIDGNNIASAGVDAQGIARSVWQDVWVRNIRPEGQAFLFRGVMLSTFSSIGFSTDLDQSMTSVPYDGLYLTSGSRPSGSGGMENVGNSSNNTFISAYFEGLGIGIRIHGGDQNTFIGGSSESNTAYGVAINVGSRFNTFIGTGFENPSATADVADAGVSTKYLNTYASNRMLLQSESRAARIEGGYFQRIEVQSGAQRNTIEDVTINHWNGGPNAGGLVDFGLNTRKLGVFDEISNNFVF